MKLNFIFAAVCILACFSGYQSVSLVKRGSDVPRWAAWCVEDPAPEDNYDQHCVFGKRKVLCIKVCKPGFKARNSGDHYLKDIVTCTNSNGRVRMFGGFNFKCKIQNPGYTEQLAFTYGSKNGDEEDNDKK